MDKYRIKEVTVPLKIGNTTFFYPQIKQEREVKTGHLWWKKITKEEYWENLYIEKNGNIYTKSIDGEIAVFENKKQALAVIEKHKVQHQQQVKEYYSKNVSSWDDERFVQIHPIE